MAKATLLHQLFEFFLGRMHTNRLSQITITRIIACYQVAELRQYVEGIPVVGFFKGLSDFRKLQHQQLAVGLEDAAHIFQGHIFVRHITKAKGHAHHIKVVVGKR